MLLSLTVVSAVLAAWALGAKHLERWRLTAPMVLVIAGLAVGFSTRDGLAESLNTEVSQHIAEVILAVLLFVDATDIRGGLFGREPRAVMRLLFIALPLSVLAALVLGLWLLPNLPWAVLLVLACIVVPTDFAPAGSILRDERVPQRVRDVLDVEAGYNEAVLPAGVDGGAAGAGAARAARVVAAVGRTAARRLARPARHQLDRLRAAGVQRVGRT